MRLPETINQGIAIQDDAPSDGGDDQDDEEPVQPVDTPLESVPHLPRLATNNTEENAARPAPDLIYAASAEDNIG